MSMIVYATSDDLTGATPPWITGSAPANVGALLRWASILVAKACNRDPYNDTPTAQDAAILTDASCAQVAAWVALAVDPAKAGTDFPAPVKSSAILDGKVDRDTSRQNQAIADAANGLCDMATAILQQGGLLWLPTATGDEQPFLYDYGLSGPLDPCGVDAYSWGTQLSGWPGFDAEAAVDAELNRLLS